MSRSQSDVDGNDHNWMTRLSQLLRGKRDGDVVIGRVGEEARGVAVGKNIIQIGTVVIPTLPVLTVVFLIAAILTFQVWKSLLPSNPQVVVAPTPTASPEDCHTVRRVDPTEMTGEFNIAVAQFGELDADGKVRPSQDGQRLSQWLFDRLQDEYDTPCPQIAVQLWHDSLDAETKEVEIGTLSGDTPQDRAQEAAALAKDISAHLIVYGNLAVSGEPASFVPEFYVTDLSDAEEILGQHRLGSPIPVQLPIDRLQTQLHLNEKLTSRTKALTLFNLGLAWDYLGDPDKAMEFFEQAEGIEGWEGNEGKEVLYLFIGREARLLAREDPTWDLEARKAFEQALQLDPDYARAHIGLGNVYYAQAERLLEEKTLGRALRDRLGAADERGILERLHIAGQLVSSLDWIEYRWEGDEVEQALEQAIAEYQRALTHLSNTPAGRVEVNARLALAGAYRYQGYARLFRENYDAADPLFDQAVEEYQRTISLAGSEEYRYLGAAYLGLGNTYQQQAYVQYTRGDAAAREALLEEALGAYAKCIEYADAGSFDWFLRELKSDYCVPYQETAQQELLELQEQGGNR